ncbi:MAG: glycosyl transferase [Rhodospirillaceae bacterium]|nr:glycosyl transferase [Rhodospirillaceae bacterium]
MRIAFYAPLKSPYNPVPSGDRRVARLLLDVMRRAGHEVRVASRLRAFEGSGDLRRQAQIKRRAASLVQRYVQMNGRNPPDLWFTYHLYHKAPDWLGPAISTALSIPYIVAEASFAPKQVNGPWAEGHAHVHDAVRDAARILVLNPNDTACLLPLLDDPGQLVRVPPFIEMRSARQAGFDRRLQRADFAALYNLDPNTLWVAVVAMMRPGDKLESYRILARAKRQLSDLPLTWLVAGDGPARNDVKAALGLHNTVFLGAQDARGIDLLHGTADLVVWPAHREAFGMALLEAQAAGIPVVAGASPGVAQIVSHGKTGLLTPTGDDTMLASAVRRLVEDQSLRERMGVAAMKKAERFHAIGAATQQIDRVLREAVTR